MASAAPPQAYLALARDSVNAEDCMKIYDKWAASYNAEVGDSAQDYVAPVLVAKVAIKSTTTPAESVILDAGCGTGLVGQALAAEGAKTIDGIDLSSPMLEIARQAGVYRTLEKADLTKRLHASDNTYDLITCVGTFTKGHVGPSPALREFVRITKPNGVIVATILEELWIDSGFEAEVEGMKADGLVNVVASGREDYVRGHNDRAVLLVLEKQASA